MTKQPKSKAIKYREFIFYENGIVHTAKIPEKVYQQIVESVKADLLHKMPDYDPFNPDEYCL